MTGLSHCRRLLLAGIVGMMAALAGVQFDLRAQRPSIIEEWNQVQAPSPPDVQPVAVESATTALLILDMQQTNCNPQSRPRCTASIPAVAGLLQRARQCGVMVVYSLTGSGSVEDILTELTPQAGEAVVKAGPDKFRDPALESLLRKAGIKSVIVVGTSAQGAVLNTAAAAVFRGLDVVVPVDGVSAPQAYGEQYTVWHLHSSPGLAGKVRLTQSDLVELRSSTDPAP